ncbi:MAG: hypothetical protein U1F98_07550 [Verrucomicrobiota bacterium]
MSFKYDFAVSYRVYPGIGREAIPLFEGDKFLLTRVAFQSFVRAVEGFKVKLTVLLDGCPAAYEEFFRSAWSQPSLEIVHYTKKGNYGTFQDQMTQLDAEREAEFLCVAEDDYFFLPEAFRCMHELLKAHPEVDYLTPYDHLEYYVSRHQEMSHEVLADPKMPVWRTVPSTTCSFVARPEAFRDNLHAFRSYGKPFWFNYGTDGTMWLAITKHRVYDPFRAMRWLGSAKYVAWSWFTAWTLCGLDILFKKPRKLWAPIPSLALHLVHSYLPPGVDWNRLLAEAIEEDRRSKSQHRP